MFACKWLNKQHKMTHLHGHLVDLAFFFPWSGSFFLEPRWPLVAFVCVYFFFNFNHKFKDKLYYTCTGTAVKNEPDIKNATLLENIYQCAEKIHKYTKKTEEKRGSTTSISVAAEDKCCHQKIASVKCYINALLLFSSKAASWTFSKQKKERSWTLISW